MLKTFHILLVPLYITAFYIYLCSLLKYKIQYKILIYSEIIKIFLINKQKKTGWLNHPVSSTYALAILVPNSFNSSITSAGPSSPVT